jgi:hypothetical protein
MGANPFVVHAPGRTRTSDPQLRRLLLYPPELLALPVTQVGYSLHGLVLDRGDRI